MIRKSTAGYYGTCLLPLAANAPQKLSGCRGDCVKNWFSDVCEAQRERRSFCAIAGLFLVSFW
jgi:hypothetical protein